MANTDYLAQPLYLIRLRENISPQVADWFEKAIVVTTIHDETLMVCPLVDQAALHGLLAKIRDLNLTLVSVSRL